MYKIPTIEEKVDRRKPSVLLQNKGKGFVRLEPSIYTVPQYPLSFLRGYSIPLYNPYTTKGGNFVLQSVYNATDDVFLGVVGGLGGLGVNTYTKKINTLYALLPVSCTSLSLTFVIFTVLTGLTTDISAYTDKGCVLQTVNLTGHIADFSSTVKTFTLGESLLSKVGFPIPAALTFSWVVDITGMSYFTVYNMQSNPGSVDYVLYNNTMYRRSTTVTPAPQTYTTRAGGGLLWI